MQIQYYTVEETAKILKTKESTVRAYCREGKIPAVRIGRGYRIAREDLDQWLEQQKKSPDLIHEEEKKLIVTEARYRDIFENASDAIALFDVTGRLTVANPKFYQLYGYTPEEAKGMHFAHFVYPEDLPLATERFMLRMAGEDVPSRYEARAVNKKGQVFTVEINSSSFISEGESSGVQAILRDVSERRRAEKALKESEARYRAVVEDQSELICRWLQNGQLTFVNEAYCRYFGKKQDELIGHSFMPLIPEEDQKIIEKHTKKMTPKNPAVTYEHRVFNSTGEIRWIQRTDRLISNEKNDSIEYQCVGRDVTERKESEKEKGKLTRAIEASSEGIAILDANEKFTYMNQAFAKVHGYEPKELIGNDWLHLVPKEHAGKIETKIREALKSAGKWQGSCEAVKKDGNKIRVSMALTVFKDDKGKPTGFVNVLKGVSEGD